MLHQVLELSRTKGLAGQSVSGLLATRALLEVAFSEAVLAHRLLTHARHQLTLQFRKDDPEPGRQLVAKVAEQVRSGVDSVNGLLEALATATANLDDFAVVQEAPQAVAGMAAVLSDNERFRKEVGAALKTWRESLEQVARK